MDGKLTDKQELFIREYLVDLNGTQAYMRAGYKCTINSARREASLLLTNVDIMRAVDEGKKKRADKIELTADWVLNNLRNVALRCQQGEEVKEWDYEEKQLIPTGEYKFDSQGANKALELIGKHLKLFTDKVELTGAVIVFKDETKLED